MARLFLCDPEANYRALVRTVLDGIHQIVGEASDARTCIELVGEAAPDVVLLEVDLPGMDGLEALPLISERAPLAKVVALSTGFADFYEQRFLDAGGYAYIEKPRDIMA